MESIADHFEEQRLLLDMDKANGISIRRNSHRSCSVTKGVLRNFAKFKGKHLCQSLRPATLLKKRLWHRSFPVNFAEFQRTPFFIEHLRWLLLHLLKVLFFDRRAGINKWGRLHFFFNLSGFLRLLEKHNAFQFPFFRRLLLTLRESIEFMFRKKQ